MSDITPPKNVSDFEKTIAHLKEKWGETKACPMCGGSSWGVSDVPCEIRQAESSAGRYRYHPVIPVECKSCGFIALVSAISIGIVAPENTSPAIEEEAKK